MLHNFQHSLTEKHEMSITCKHRVSVWCRAHFTYFQCKVYVGEDNSFVARLATKTTWLGTWFDLGKDKPQSLGWKSCVWPIQPPRLLRLQTVSLFKLLTDDKKCGAGMRHFSSRSMFVWKSCWVSQKTLTICVHVHKSIDYILLLFHEMLWYWAGISAIYLLIGFFHLQNNQTLEKMLH